MAKLTLSKCIADHVMDNIAKAGGCDPLNPFRHLISDGIHVFRKKLKAKSKRAESIVEQKNLEAILEMLENIDNE